MYINRIKTKMKFERKSITYNILTQVEWERLLKPGFSPSPQLTVKLSSTPLFPSPSFEESIKIIQKRVENAVSESVKKAITKYGRNMKHLRKHFIK